MGSPASDVPGSLWGEAGRGGRAPPTTQKERKRNPGTAPLLTTHNPPPIAMRPPHSYVRMFPECTRPQTGRAGGGRGGGRGRAIWCVAWIDSCACGRWGHTQVTALLSRLGSARDWAYGGAHMPSRALRSDIRPGPCCDPPPPRLRPQGAGRWYFIRLFPPPPRGGFGGLTVAAQSRWVRTWRPCASAAF